MPCHFGDAIKWYYFAVNKDTFRRTYFDHEIGGSGYAKVCFILAKYFESVQELCSTHQRCTPHRNKINEVWQGHLLPFLRRVEPSSTLFLCLLRVLRQCHTQTTLNKRQKNFEERVPDDVMEKNIPGLHS